MGSTVQTSSTSVHLEDYQQRFKVYIHTYTYENHAGARSPRGTQYL